MASRDHAADSEFVYAVATTGIYCRPSCKSPPQTRKRRLLHAARAGRGRRVSPM
ncbi:Ada metal-binding domain-containing protein [Candidatus Flexifilum breve]|uniref:Ada metal-binding domain-containing protein n=1 Tax=Candidatus Flexifilum breve TaxID=3140694 RepID=UPI0031CCC6EF